MRRQLSYHLIHWTMMVKWDTNIRNLRINLLNIFDITCKQGIKLWRLSLLASLICACLRYPSKLVCRKRHSFHFTATFPAVSAACFIKLSHIKKQYICVSSLQKDAPHKNKRNSGKVARPGYKLNGELFRKYNVPICTVNLTLLYWDSS